MAGKEKEVRAISVMAALAFPVRRPGLNIHPFYTLNQTLTLPPPTKIYARVNNPGKGFRIGNAGVTPVCEFPGITPHAAAMQSAPGALAGIAPDRVSVEATTSGRPGFTGRGEGIAAMATATPVSP